MKIMSRHRVVKANSDSMRRKTRIVAAGEDENLDDFVEDFDEDFDEGADADDFTDTLDDVADDIEDIQDSVDDFEEDDIDIEVDNNITGHYIAECEECQGIFISAVVHSEQQIQSVKGVCPCCNEETEQFLKWVIQAVDDGQIDEEETSPYVNDSAIPGMDSDGQS